MNREAWFEELTPGVRSVVERLWLPPLIHPRLADAHARVVSSLLGPPTKPITTVTGPTRTGKTTLLELLEAELNKDYAALIAAVPHAHPVVRFELTAPPSGVFSFASCFVDPLIEELSVPMKARRMPLVEPGPDLRLVRTASRRLSLPEAVNAGVQACRNYEGRVLLVDEGHHFGMVRSHEAYMNNLEALKTFVNRAGVRIVLAGTHDLESVRDMSAQMIARSTNVRLPRYRLEDGRDVLAFKTILRNLSRRLPEGTPPLEPEWTMLMERSLGLVGLLVDWLLTAVAQAAAKNHLPKLIGYLDRARLDDDEVEAVEAEIEEGEGARAETLAERALSRAERDARRADQGVRLAKLRARANGKTPRTAGKIGRRRPAHDPVLVGKDR